MRLSLETGEQLRQQVAVCEEKIKSLQDQCSSKSESLNQLTECKNKLVIFVKLVLVYKKALSFIVYPFFLLLVACSSIKSLDRATYLKD